VILQLRSTYYICSQKVARRALSQYDEDIESMNGRDSHTKRKQKIKIFTRLCNLSPEGARVDDQDGHSFGTLFL
jgi:hypothetical protein